MLISTIKSIPNNSLLWNDVNKNNVIAWLENQSKQKPIVPLDENGEPILTEFESALFTTISYFWQSYNLGAEVSIAEFAKEYAPELLEAAKKQKQIEWSDEDKKMLEGAIEILDKLGGDRNKIAYTLSELDCRRKADWLKAVEYKLLNLIIEYKNVEQGFNISTTKLTLEIKRRIECFKAEKDKVGASQIDKLSLGGRIVALEELLYFINSLQDKQ